jgi:hypothetical protein
MVGVDDSKRRTARRMESGMSRGIYVNNCLSSRSMVARQLYTGKKAAWLLSWEIDAMKYNAAAQSGLNASRRHIVCHFA